MQETEKCGFSPWVGKIPWRRARHPTPVFLSGESHGQRSLMGYSPWGHKLSDTTEHARTHVCWETMAEQAFRQVFFRRFYELSFLPLISRIALKLLTETSVPGDQHKPGIHTDLSPYLLGAFPQSYLRGESWALVLILLQIKTTHRSHIAYFFHSTH